MLRRGPACVIALVLAGAPILPMRAQAWNEPRALTLVRRATDRRVQQLADSGLTDYQATAHGYLTFLAQLGEGFREPPRVVKADELALQVYWRAPNLSKQRIIGRRDTTLLPTDIAYHRDHLGIIQNNFPAIIRIGEGDEVRDVPHPLSDDGMRQYEFALTDSLRITIPGRVIDVYELQVRPVDDRQARVIGAIYLERDNGQVVRMAFSFTRASFLDKQLEDLFIVLENGLFGSRFWLPRRQEIEIRRTLTWLDYPVRGIIRGRWDIGDYQLNMDVSSVRFIGPEIVMATPAELLRYEWPPGRLVDSLPVESRLPTPSEIKKVQDETRALVREQALRRPRQMVIARGASDFVSFNRSEGVALGLGLGARLGGGFVLKGRGHYAFGDRRGRGTLEFGWQDARGSSALLYLSDDVRDAGDVPERSRLVNSFAAQEFGSDFTNLFGVRARGIAATSVFGETRWTLDGAVERQFALGVHGAPFSHSFRTPFSAANRALTRVALRLDQPTTPGWFGFEWRGHGEARASEANEAQSLPFGQVWPRSRIQRVALAVELERRIGDARILGRTFAAGVSGDPHLLRQDLVFLGGTVSAPGYGYHELIGDRALSQHVELQLPVAFPSLNLGRFGRMPSRAALTPHASIVSLQQVDPTSPVQGSALPAYPFRAHPSGVYSSVGVSLITGFDLLRLDVSRALPTGRWMFAVDITRAYWSIL